MLDIIPTVSVFVNGVNSIVLPMINQQQHLREKMFSPFQERFSDLSADRVMLACETKYGGNIGETFRPNSNQNLQPAHV